VLSATSPGGSTGHGTDMSLVIAGTGAGTGYEGVAPGVKILPVKVFHADRPGGIRASDRGRGSGWAVDHGAKVVNVSLEHPGSM